MEVEVYRNKREIFCVVTSCSKDDVLLNEEHIRNVAFEYARTEKEEDIIMNSEFIIVPRDNGGFYVEFEGFFEEGFFEE